MVCELLFLNIFVVCMLIFVWMYFVCILFDVGWDVNLCVYIIVFFGWWVGNVYVYYGYCCCVCSIWRILMMFLVGWMWYMSILFSMIIYLCGLVMFLFFFLVVCWVWVWLVGCFWCCILWLWCDFCMFLSFSVVCGLRSIFVFVCELFMWCCVVWCEVDVDFGVWNWCMWVVFFFGLR